MLIADSNIKIFATLQTIAPELKIFGVASGEELDTIYLDSYSLRTVAGKYSDPDKDYSERIAKLIKTKYSIKWDSLVDYYKASVLALSKAGNSITENTKTTTDGTNNMTDTGNVSPYNNDDFAPDNQSVSEGKNHSEIVKERQYLNTRVSDMNFGAKYSYLQFTDVCDTIFMDTNSIYTVSVHSINDD